MEKLKQKNVQELHSVAVEMLKNKSKHTKKQYDAEVEDVAIMMNGIVDEVVENNKTTKM